MFELDFILCKGLTKFRPHCVQLCAQQVVCGLGLGACTVCGRSGNMLENDEAVPNLPILQ